MRVDAVLAHVGDAVGDPLDVLLDGVDHVGQHRRAAGAGDEEQVRETGHRQPEIGLRPLGPGLAEVRAARALDVDGEQRAGHGVEPGREHDGVDLVGRLRSVRTPVGVISSIGVSRRFTSVTFGRL